MPVGVRLAPSGRGSRFVFACLCLAATLTPLAPAARADDAVAAATPIAGLRARFDEALVAYERSHWPHAYRMLAALADEGHGESARIALQMWRHGHALYRTEFQASAQQVERWTRLWACAGEGVDSSCSTGVVQKR